MPHGQNGKVVEWLKELRLLSAIAVSQPRTAFAAYTHGMTSKWLYLSRTSADIGYQLQALEDIIRLEFIPALTGRSLPNNTDGKLMALPARLGGLEIADPPLTSEYEFNASMRVMYYPIA